MKTAKECEEIGRKMKLDEFLSLEIPTSFYMQMKYINMLSGFLKKSDISMEDKVKAFKHGAVLIGFTYESDEDIVAQINKEMCI